MDARELYRRSKSGRILGALLKIHQKFYAHPYKGRALVLDTFERYVHRPASVLMLGSNLPRSSFAALGDAVVQQLDIKPLENVDLVMDAETMSETIPHGTFDYVVSTSMLEHTPRPWKVVDSIASVLKPGGICLLSVPWMFPLHGEPDDFWRFSMQGLRRLVFASGLVEVESGSEVSPHGAVYSLLKAYVSESLSYDNSIAYYCLDFLAGWLLAPVGLLERWAPLSPSRKNFYTDSLVYIVARKPDPRVA
jgi:SAM-dependent methyltransferase